MGTVCISVDAELGWGFFDTDEPPMGRLNRAAWGWNRLRELCDRYEIPTTWAIVGHLCLDDCDGVHSDHPLGSERFERERTEWATRRSLRFGSSLVDDVLSADVDHEIGSHSFSHPDFGDDSVTDAVVRAELAQFEAVTDDYEIDATSFIFPRNHIAYRELLADWGYRCYRDLSPTRQLEPLPRRQFEKLRHTTVGSPPLVRPHVDEYGLVAIPASLYLFGFEGYGRSVAELVGTDPIVRQAIHGIDAVAATDELFHLWLHPNNITTLADLDRLEAIWEYLAAARDAGRVDVMTMGEIAHDVRSAEPQYA